MRTDADHPKVISSTVSHGSRENLGSHGNDTKNNNIGSQERDLIQALIQEIDLIQAHIHGVEAIIEVLVVTEAVFQEVVSGALHVVSRRGAEAQEDLMNPSSLMKNMTLKVPMLSLIRMKLNES